MKKVGLSNRLNYTLIAVSILILSALTVYAYGGGLGDPAIMGHTIDEVDPPSGCTDGKILGWDEGWVCVDDQTGSNFPTCSSGLILKSSGSGWDCATDETGGSSLWTDSGSNIYYNSGNVGIGTTSPTQKLDVEGNIKASGTICDSNGCIGGGSGGGALSMQRVDYTGTISCGTYSSISVSCPSGTVLTDCGVKDTTSQRRMTDIDSDYADTNYVHLHHWTIDRGTDSNPDAPTCRFKLFSVDYTFCGKDWTVSAYCLGLQ